MVSYFVPRGRFLIKAGNLRQASQIKQQQQQQGKWAIPTLKHFRQTFSSKQNQYKTSNESNNVKIGTLLNRDGSINATKVQNDNVCLHQQQQKRRNIWLKWTGFLLRWTPVGIILFGAIEWQLHKRKCDDKKTPRTASSFQSKVYCSLPLRIISRCWGWLAACYVPVPLRPYIYGWYSNVFQVNLDEALHPDFKHYKSLADFFTRELREGVRPIDQKAPLISPADGRVLHFGSTTNSLVEQVKGVNYSLEAFLGPASWCNQTDKIQKEYTEIVKQRQDDSTSIYQCVIYLAPGDYHRFHSPVEWKPTLRRHFAGELLSVNPRVATWLPDLFCLNERAVYLGNWRHGFFSYTAVGATNVGSVKIYMDDELKTNRWVGLKMGAHKDRHLYDELVLPADKNLTRGELLGQFNMGSTIVLLFEAPKNFKFTIEAGQTIRVGEPIGHFL